MISVELMVVIVGVVLIVVVVVAVTVVAEEAAGVVVVTLVAVAAAASAVMVHEILLHVAYAVLNFQIILVCLLHLQLSGQNLGFPPGLELTPHFWSRNWVNVEKKEKERGSKRGKFVT